MAFEKYDKHTINKFPTISLLQSKNLSINIACVEKHFKGTKSIELFYDKDGNRIGIKPFQKKDNAMFSLCGKDGRSAHISCRGFIKHFNIPVLTTKQYNPKWNEKEELLEIHLDKPLTNESIQKAPSLSERRIERQTSSKMKL
jgi:hypothetical protein